MAQAGFTPISLYYSTTASALPTGANLVAGELALNTVDEKLYFKNSGGTVKLLASVASTSNVSSITFGSTGLTPSTATTGAVTVAGTLAIANGGTGSTSTTYCSLTTNVTGTLPVANGGTGIVSFGTGVAGALGQNVSGSGSIALTTSAVLTTPNLGTPSAGTLTSCTGLPLTTGVTGILPIANGGTNSSSTTYCSLTTNVTGTLPVANGGTGITSLGAGIATFLGTPSSANLAAAVTDETGSGALVFATSPTLVTPVLGTPSSGTLTSCTGLPLTTGVTGTLPVANGGTGVASTTAYAVLCGGTTTTGPFQAIASVGTSGQVLTSNGAGALPTFQTAGGAAFPSGTVMLFAQTSAPTGWTKNTTTGDNSALRVVTGTASTGGSQGFTTAFASQTPTGSVSITTVSGSAGATTLTTPQIPSHAHKVFNSSPGNPGTPAASSYRMFNTFTNNGEGLGFGGGPYNDRAGTDNTGGGGSHTHPFSFSSGSGTFTGNAINLAVQYIDVIRATAN